MIERIEPIATWCAAGVEALGVVIITAVVVYVLGYAAYRLLGGMPAQEVYDKVRLRLGRGILLGLEMLVAGDIIHTVAVDLTFRTVGVLGVIVIIRTFLSFTLEVELTGRWPWQEQNGR